ncbi:SAV_6107 family HEPN domain-containing protein [Blastococcus atacamensis]|uniref:SAV_6107 family HEPN domain-containing protein n=1 Tax=Blastococcus atacamensis TaxID=2070508 RepID=UPI000CEBD63F|nr:SAV_6107 family HEPN domain-containing protein [Blastococcus atacamensis]
MGARPLMADQLPLPPALPAAAASLLDQARRGLAEAAGCTDVRQRYATAHLGALRAAAAVLAARTRPESGRRRPRSAWALLEQVAPELGEWATFFAAGAAKRAAAEAGLSSAVTEREADDLVRDVGTFLAVVANCLGASAEPAYPRPRVVGGTAAELQR